VAANNPLKYIDPDGRQEKSALPIEVTHSFGVSLQKAPLWVGQNVHDVFSGILKLLKQFQPSGDNLFHWRSNPAKLAIRKVNFTLMLKNDPALPRDIANNPKRLAATIIERHRLTGERRINIYLVLDRAPGTSSEEKIAFLIDAAAHEGYGHVPKVLQSFSTLGSFQSARIDSLYAARSDSVQNEEEIDVYQNTAIPFLQRLAEAGGNSLTTFFPKGMLRPEKMPEALQFVLKDNEASLNSALKKR